MSRGILTGNVFVQRLLMIINLVCFILAWIALPTTRPHPGIPFALFSGLCGVIFACALIPWYVGPYRGLGIEDHFYKIAMGVNYAALLVNLLQLSGMQIPATWLSIFLSPVLVALIAVNAILLKYHFRDPDKTAPAYFAANLYLHQPGATTPPTRE